MVQFLDLVVLRAPRLPRRRFCSLTHLAASGALHAVVFAIVGSIAFVPNGVGTPGREEIASEETVDVQRIVFATPDTRHVGGGGGGGGNQQPGPIRRARGVGADPITLRTRRTPPAAAPVTSPPPARVEDAIPLPSIVLDTSPLAAGAFEQMGLPAAGTLSGTSTGPGSGGGVGTGTGTGIGSGRGPGLGPGSGGGAGGGVYRAGGSVTAPRVIVEVKPKYTSDALLRNVQGTVVLEVVVTRDGRPSRIRVVRSLDAGLDAQAIAATEQWRFEPGRLAGTPVDVLVIVMLDFWIR